MNCALCGSRVSEFSVVHKRAYHHCANCDAISLHHSYFLSNDKERKRYEIHNNDVTDPGYQNFVSPIVNAIIKDYDKSHKGLDFGSGSDPVITTMLRHQGYAISTYDPFFDPNSRVLQSTYNYIACCEVMEHFYHPNKEFKLLHSLLKDKGRLYCKTYLYDESIDFDSWWYKNDLTHVFFYTKKTLNWIKDYYGFSEVIISEKLIIFQK
ncbi:class I SAM-dependent methyltransferase [uncultured Aquimarina sp.]|uniref:class I SAM-dependent methyltransferase n=1 Tax=uncultured Aquimarina sp. TaxID=575652 RepID=UPI00261C6F41|nr:class I SAM-dependent methyltransferase [uncultured Aquimarina sp.]